MIYTNRPDDDLMRYFKLSTTNAPTDEGILSFTKWMNAVKPLIQDESGFVEQTHDFVTVPREIEDGFLEDGLEKLVRKYGVGQNVGQDRLPLEHLITC